MVNISPRIVGAVQSWLDFILLRLERGMDGRNQFRQNLSCSGLIEDGSSEDKDGKGCSVLV